MNDLFCPFILVFFDDILVYSRDFQAHHDCVLQTLQQGAFHLKSPKCVFGQRCIEYLGHFVSLQGVEPDPSKIQAMLQWAVSVISQTIAWILGLDWILSVLHQELCTNHIATYPFIMEGPIRMVFRSSINL